MPQDSNAHPALQLFDAGYRDLVSILPPDAEISSTSKLDPTTKGKAPAIRQADGKWKGFTAWQSATTTRDDVTRWIADGAGFGLRTRAYPAIDVDVFDPAIASAVEAVLVELFGDVLRRTGQPPKFAVPCRAEETFGKITLKLVDAAGASHGKIEFLADGQQFVVVGPHAQTKRPYTWRAASESGGGELLAARPPESLPVLSPQIISEQIVPHLRKHLQAFGVRVIQSGDGSKRSDVDQATLRAPSIDELRRAVATIPNDDDADRDFYVAIGHATKAAAGPEHDAEGCEIYLEWAGRWTEGDNDPAEVRLRWDGFSAPFDIGWPWIEDRAQHGDEFSVVAGEVLPEVSAPSEATSESERVAALLGEADRVFLSELSDRTLTDRLARWCALGAAAHRGDALGAVWTSVVLPIAAELGKHTDDERKFAAIAAARLRLNADWKRLSRPDQQLLLRTAYVFAAPRSVLAGVGRRGPRRLLGRRMAPPTHLLGGWIPAVGVGALVGPPGHGKTHVALALGATVATVPAEDALTGTPTPERFSDRDVMHGSALIFPGEAATGVAHRRDRIEAAAGFEIPHLHIDSDPLPLSNVGDAISAVLASWGLAHTPQSPPLRLIVIDPLRQSMVGDENSSEVMGNAMATAYALSQIFGAFVLTVHHSPKEKPSDARGSSAFLAAMDFVGAVNERGGTFTLTVVKNKEGPAGESFVWHLDENGVLREGAAAVRPEALSTSEEKMYVAARVLRAHATREVGVSKTDLFNALRTEEPALFSSQPDDRKAASRRSRAIKDCIEAGLIEFRKNRYYPGPNEPPALPLMPGSLEDIP